MLSSFRVSVLGGALLLASGAGCDSGSSATYRDSVLGAGYKPAQKKPEAVKAAAGSGIETTLADAGPSAVANPCVKAVASDSLPARGVVMSSEAGPDQTQVFTRDLFNLFRSYCGGCHVDSDRGGLHVNLSNFPQVITQMALSRITSDDPSYYMPPSGPGSGPFSKRSQGDPIIEFASLLEQWLAAGSPADSFLLASSKTGATKSPYLMTTQVGMALTNLGNCVPDRTLVGVENDHASKMDAFFASATALPDKLEDTDFVSFDSEVLAREGVIGFAPAYTLWADNAKKIRAVRVPRGQKIEFDKTTQTFTIPPNTRFYKTFLKHVIDADGSERYRKVETRLIVSRPGSTSPDGQPVINALFGTYAWNDSETEALLVKDPLRNGEPFRDRLLTVITDEPKAKMIKDSNPPNVDDALRDAGVTRTYAIPGSERCKDCHMGSDNNSFVLGFIPLQLHRRPMGEGGVIEPADRDELNQLQRLIDYGVISGMTSPDDVVLLEDSEGDRKPRNDYELQAQGYMLGNCAHCHNPVGKPTVENPELRDLLNFRPTPMSGIFQFPLERYSPRIHRGLAQEELIPYITPSLVDHASETFGSDLIPTSESSSSTYSSKVAVAIIPQVDSSGQMVQVIVKNQIFAPWRSLIYRNVDNPFPYAEDFAIFPHMPRNTPGYDCRARRILGSWMVSIPGHLKPGIDQFAAELDATPQPFVELMPGDDHYDSALSDGMDRVKVFQSSWRYQDCPDPPLDIVDPDVVAGRILTPIPLNLTLTQPDGTKAKIDWKTMPNRPHWAVTDLTDAPGDWAPRRSDWQNVLVQQMGLDGDDKRDLRTAVSLLQSVTITDELRQFALSDVPFGLWQQKSSCDFSKVKKASDFTGAGRPRWMDIPTSGIKDGSEPVYSISPGAEVFTIICSNCHGPLADSHGRVADTIADMTGGETRVANLRDGILGPIDDPGANRKRVFGVAATSTVTVDDWAGRYAAFMGLGGTQRKIPEAALIVVGNTTVLGQKRSLFSPPPGKGANMLTVAQTLCADILPSRQWAFDARSGHLPIRRDGGTPDSGGEQALIAGNGDWELWEHLCTLDNPLPIRVVGPGPWRSQDTQSGNLVAIPDDQLLSALHISYVAPDRDLYRREGYPANIPVGDDQGHVLPGLSGDVHAPWCLRKPIDPDDLVVAQKFAEDHALGGQPLPFCPDGLFASDPNDGHQLYELTDDDVTSWTLRAAMNAGLSVFTYLDALERGKAEPVIPYNQCERLAP